MVSPGLGGVGGADKLTRPDFALQPSRRLLPNAVGGNMRSMTRALTVIGVPCSAGAHHAGLERAPAALRAAGLLGRLRRSGREVSDAGIPGGP